MDERVYYGDWTTRDEMVRDFLPYQVSSYRDDEGGLVPDDAEILIAAYTYENYSGTAFVLFRQNGKLYEVNGSHCSCYGLEGQWEPEEVVVAELRKRPSYFGYLDEDAPGTERKINAAIRRVAMALTDEEEA